MGGDGSPALSRNRTAWIACDVDVWLDTSDCGPDTTTARIYAFVAAAFGRWRPQRDLELASAEPRWLLATTPHPRLLAMAKAMSSTAMPTAGSAYSVHDEEDVVDVWDLAEHRVREFAAAVEGYAATRIDARRSRVSTAPAAQAQHITDIAKFYRFAFKHGYFYYGLNPIGNTSW